MDEMDEMGESSGLGDPRGLWIAEIQRLTWQVASLTASAVALVLSSVVLALLTKSLSSSSILVLGAFAIAVLSAYLAWKIVEDIKRAAADITRLAGLTMHT